MDKPPPTEGLVLRDMSYRGTQALRAVQEAASAQARKAAAAAPAQREADPNEILMGKARNLGLKLPPVNQEIERLQRLKARLSDRVDLADLTGSGASTTLGDVVLGTAQGDDGLPLLGKHRGVDVSLLRQVNTIARHVESAPMKSDVRSWVEEAQRLQNRADRVLEEYLDEKQLHRDHERLAGQSRDTPDPQMQSMAATVRSALSCIEVIKSVVVGTAPPDSFLAFQGEDLFSKAAHTGFADVGSPRSLRQSLVSEPEKTDREALEDAIMSLRADMSSLMTELRGNPLAPARGAQDKRSEARINSIADGSDDEAMADLLAEGDDDSADGTADFDFKNLPGSNPVLQAARQMERGISAAALTCGLSLSPEQVKDVLREFYLQPRYTTAPSCSVRRKQKLRLERRYIETLKREEETVRRLKETIDELRSELEAKSAELEEDRRAKNGEESLAHGTVQMLNERVKRERALVETLSSKRVKELETKAAEMEQEFDTVVQSHEKSHVLFEKLKKDYDGLLEAVQCVRQQWEKKEVELAQKEKELELLQQGRRRDDQLWRARLVEVVKAMVHAMAPLPGAFAGLHTVLKNLGQHSSMPLLTGLMNPVLNMMTTAVKYAPHECFRATLTEITQLLETFIVTEHAADSDMDLNPPSIEITNEVLAERAKVLARATPQMHDHCMKLTEQLQEKIEMLATENRSKFREARYIKNVIQYACQLIDMIITGNSPVPEEGLGDKGMPFPPPHVVASDKDYAYFWLDEKKMLEEALTSLNLFAIHGGTKPNAVNSLLSVLGFWRENVDRGENATEKNNNSGAHGAALGSVSRVPSKAALCMTASFGATEGSGTLGRVPSDLGADSGSLGA